MNPTLPTHQIKYILIGLFLLAAIGAGLFSLRASQDTRDMATSQTGTAKFVFTKTSPSTIQISATGTGQSVLDGLQLIAGFTGTIPTDLKVVPTAPTGLNPVATTITDVTGGKKLTFVFVSANPQTPFQANSASVVLGNLQFTPPANGSMVITVDQLATKILQSSTGVDLLGPIAPVTIAMGTATPSPVATILPPPPTAPTPTPTPTSLPVITPTPTIRPTATPTPMPTPVITPRPTSTPTPVVMVTPTPIVVVPPPSVPPTQSGSQTFRIASGGRDVNEENKKVKADGSTIWIGNGSPTASYTAFQFGTTLIPRATIASAWIELYTPKEVWIPLKIDVRGLVPSGTNHSAPFTSTALPSLRNRTAASTLISTNEKTPTGTWQKIDVTTIVQEIVNHPEFANNPEKMVAFILRGTGTKFARKYVSSVESGTATAPILRVTYATTPSAPIAGTPSPVPASSTGTTTGIVNWFKSLFQ